MPPAHTHTHPNPPPHPRGAWHKDRPVMTASHRQPWRCFCSTDLVNVRHQSRKICMHILCSAVPESICDTIRISTARTSHRGKVRGVGRAPLWPQATSNPLKNTGSSVLYVRRAEKQQQFACCHVRYLVCTLPRFSTYNSGA